MGNLDIFTGRLRLVVIIPCNSRIISSSSSYKRSNSSSSSMFLISKARQKSSLGVREAVAAGTTCASNR